MIRHCVLFRWLPDTTDEQVDDVARSLLAYAATLDGVVSYRVGRDIGASTGTYDFAALGDFETLDAYLAYRDDPRHVEIVTGVANTMLAERAAVQFELD